MSKFLLKSMTFDISLTFYGSDIIFVVAVVCFQQQDQDESAHRFSYRRINYGKETPEAFS